MPLCTLPTVVYTKVSNCPAETFNVTANITNLGSATSITITDSQASPSQQVTATGLVTFWSYTSGTSVVLTATNDQNSICTVVSSAQTQPACPPANDTCLAAIPLTVGSDFAGQVVSGAVLGATTTSGVVPSCQASSVADVWYSVVVPASGSLTVEAQEETSNSITDSVLAAFSGPCGSLTSIGCDDDAGAGNMSLLSLTGLTPGATIYIGLWKYNTLPTATANTFKISAYDASLGTESFDLNGFASYPNPVVDFLNLSYTKNITKVAVHNLVGQEIMTKTINATQSKIDMSNLSNGTYLVKVTVDGLEKTLKVLKQ